MRISINQPHFFPWLGYFERIYHSDLHIQLDHVQFEKNSLINRNKILLNGSPKFITVPCITAGKFKNLPIKSVEIASSRVWVKKMLATLHHAYSKSPNYSFLIQKVEPLLLSPDPCLIHLLRSTLDLTRNALHINTPIVSSSTMNLTAHKSDLVLEICIKLGASEYLSGPLGRDYLDLASFKRHNIDVLFHDYKPLLYDQYPQSLNITGLSVLDYMFNHSPESFEQLPICLNLPK